MRSLPAVLACVLLVGCKPEPGENGAPCRDDGSCDPDLVCFLGTCSLDAGDFADVRVGVLTPLTSEVAALALGWEEAVRMAADDVNQAGGILGDHPLRPLLVDTEGDPAVASDVARALIEQEQVVGLVGPALTRELLEVAPIASRRETPIVTCCATSPLLSDPRFTHEPWIFRTAPDDEEQGRALARLAAAGAAAGGLALAPCDKAAVARRADAWGEAVAASFVAAFEEARADQAAVLVEAPYEEPGPDETLESVADQVAATLAPTLQQGQQAGERACVVLVSTPQDGAAILAALAPSLPEQASVLAPDALFDPGFAAAAGEQAARVVGVVPAVPDTDAARAFAEAFEIRTGQPPTLLAAQAYDAMALLALAVEAARSTDGDAVRSRLVEVSRGGAAVQGGDGLSEAIRAARAGEDIDYQGPSGDVDLDERGDVEAAFAPWRIEAGALVVVDAAIE